MKLDFYENVKMEEVKKILLILKNAYTNTQAYFGTTIMTKKDEKKVIERDDAKAYRISYFMFAVYPWMYRQL